MRQSRRAACARAARTPSACMRCSRASGSGRGASVIVCGLCHAGVSDVGGFRGWGHGYFAHRAPDSVAAFTPGSPSTPSVGASVCAAIRRRSACGTPRARHARRLVLRRGRADAGRGRCPRRSPDPREPAPGCRDRRRAARRCARAPHRSAPGWSARGSSRPSRRVVGHRRGGRQPAPEILRRRERLADQRGADGLAVLDDQRSAGLCGKQRRAMPVTTPGYSSPVTSDSATKTVSAGAACRAGARVRSWCWLVFALQCSDLRSSRTSSAACRSA
jgi:hypothetical protein